MKIPIQIWLPFFSYSFFDNAFSRDLIRAQKNWKGEHRVWLLGDIKKPIGWKIKVGPFLFNEIAIPSETFNVLTIVHVDNEGNYFPPVEEFFPESWQGKIPQNLLKQWLNMKFDIIPGKKEIKMQVPHIKKNRIEYKSTILKLSPAPAVPLDKFNDNGKFSFRWPPRGIKFPPSVSPMTEIEEFGISCGWENLSSNDYSVVIDGKSNQFLNVWFVGCFPFDKMFPTGIDLDTVYQHMKMQKCASKNYREKITSWVGKLTAEGWTNLELSWLAPALETYGSESVLFNIEGKYDISHKSIKELMQDNRYNKIFCSPINITRCFGWSGYFWLELNEKMNKEKFTKCELCGNIISGKKGKKFCSKEENPDCFHSRRAEDVRRFRNSGKTLEMPGKE